MRSIGGAGMQYIASLSYGKDSMAMRLARAGCGTSAGYVGGSSTSRYKRL
jgi:hypothetical protein